jgi:6-methylsalicylate decarboxylase
MTTPSDLVYWSDCGVPCTSEATMDRNLKALLNFDGLTDGQKAAIGTQALQLFPSAAARLADSTDTPAARRG